jgi:hypothetical protein
MKIKIKKGFGFDNLEFYPVNGTDKDLEWFRVTNDDGESDWVGKYLVEDVLIECDEIIV